MVAQLVWVVALAGVSLFVTTGHFGKTDMRQPDWLLRQHLQPQVEACIRHHLDLRRACLEDIPEWRFELVINAAGLARPLWVVQAGTAVSSVVRDGTPNSMNLLRWDADAAPGCCRIERWDCEADDRIFRLATVSEIWPDRA